MYVDLSKLSMFGKERPECFVMKKQFSGSFFLKFIGEDESDIFPTKQLSKTVSDDWWIAFDTAAGVGGLMGPPGAIAGLVAITIKNSVIGYMKMAFKGGLQISVDGMESSVSYAIDQLTFIDDKGNDPIMDMSKANPNLDTDTIIKAISTSLDGVLSKLLAGIKNMKPKK